MCLCVEVLSLECHQSGSDFDPDGDFGGPLLAHPFTSARVQSCFEFVEIGGDMCSNCQREIPAGTGITVTGITGWYVPARTTHYMYEYIWYVQVPGSHLPYVSRVNMLIHSHFCDVWWYIRSSYLAMYIFGTWYLNYLVRWLVSVIACIIFCFICFPPQKIFRSRVIGACSVTTDCNVL